MTDFVDMRSWDPSVYKMSDRVHDKRAVPQTFIIGPGLWMTNQTLKYIEIMK